MGRGVRSVVLPCKGMLHGEPYKVCRFSLSTSFSSSFKGVQQGVYVLSSMQGEAAHVRPKAYRLSLLASFSSSFKGPPPGLSSS